MESAGCWLLSQYWHCLENVTSMQLKLCASHGLLKNKHKSFSSEKAMAPHSSTLAWQIPWTEEPGRLQSMGSLRVRHDWVTSLSLFTFMHWRRKWQPTPVFLPGESQGRGGPGGLPSMGSHRVGHDWSDLEAAAALGFVFFYLTFHAFLPIPTLCKTENS